MGILLEKRKYPIPVEGLLYVPKVSIVKNLKHENINPVTCGVIATEMRAIGERTPQYLQQRIYCLYDTAILNRHNVIILGAIGCGAFKESDDDATKLAKEMRTRADKYKDKIKTVYAIFHGKDNYKAFMKAMK